MIIWLLLEGAALIVLLGLSGFFSGSETIMMSLDPLTVRRLTAEHPQAGERIKRLLAEPHRLLSSVLIGNIFVNVAAAALGYAMAEALAPDYGKAVAIPAMTVLLLLFGEIGPKRIGLAFAPRLAVRFAVPLMWVMRAVRPLRLLLERLTRALEPFFKPHGRTLSDEEFETAVDISGEAGLINADEWAMIKSIFHLEHLKVADVMTPRVDIEGIDLDDPPEDILRRTRASRFAYLPLYRDSLDQVEGFLDVRAFLLDPDHRLENAKLPGFFLPETSPLNIALEQLQEHRRRIAVIVDEYGGTAGILTRGDILEEISGDVYDELNKPRPVFQAAGPHRWMVDPGINLEELNRKLQLRLSAENSDRLAGWIAEHLGRLPNAHDTVEAQGCRVTVLQTRKHRTTLAQIEKVAERSAV